MRRWRKAWKQALLISTRPWQANDLGYEWWRWLIGNQWMCEHEIAASLLLDGAPISELP